MKKNNRVILASFIISILLVITIICMSNMTQLSIFHEFHWICYISSMILGVYCGRNKPQVSSFGWFYSTISFLLYFFIMSFGKGKSGPIYYTQLIAIIPLNAFLFFFFAWCNSWMNKISKIKLLYRPIYWIGSLCLEIYIVQKIFINDSYNSLFPINTVIIFGEILVCAYLLNICTKLFTQTLSNSPYNWKLLFKI